MQKLSAFIFFSMLFFQSLAQSFMVRNYSVPEGLPSSETYDVFQDSKGFMWFATDNGVVRFDGYDMTVFGTADGLEDPVVFGIMEDHRGRIWFRTYSGRLFFYENGKIVRYKCNDLLVKACSKTIMSSMFMDTKEQLWFASSRLFGRIDRKGNFFADSVSYQKIYYKTIEKGYILGNSLWPKKDEFPNFIIDGKVFPLDVDLNSHHSTVNRSVIWREKLYITSNNLIFEYDGISLKKVSSGPAPIISISKDCEDNLWVGYYNIGAYRYKTQEFKNPWKPDFLKKKSVSQILFDTEGGLWVTTLENGVFYVPDMNLELQARSDSSKVMSVLASDEEVISGTYNGTVTIMDAKTKRTVLKRRIELGQALASAFKDSRGNIWVSAGNLFFCDKNLDINPRPFLSSAVQDFAEDKKGNVWTISSGGLVKFNQSGKTLSRKPHNGRFRSMLFADSVLYIAERLGVHVYDTSMNFIKAPPSLAKFKISKLLNLNDSLLLVATIGNGFLVVNKRIWTFDQFSAQKRFIADNIYAVVKTDTAFWMGTERGILITSINSLLAKDPHFIQLTKSNGLIADKTNFLAFTKQSAWAFSDEGISTIPYVSVHSKRTPEFYFKKLFINKKQVEFDQPLMLTYDEIDIALSFGFLSLKNQNIACRYRLTKNDPWIYITERKLQFSSLAPGKYQLEFELSTDNLHWRHADASLSFIVTPPWWQLWYIQVLAVSIIGCLLYLYFRNHYRILKRHQQKLIQAEIETLERERNRIAKELHDGVATNLSAIKLMVSQLLRTHSEPLAEDLDEQFLTTIMEIKDIIYGLAPPGLERHGLFVGLKNYVEKLNKTIPIKIRLDTTGKDIHKSELGILTFRIIQELLSNAVRHSFAKNISIELNAQPAQLNIVFRDDGIGFSYDPEKSGLGLANIESRIESVNGSLKFESKTSGISGSSYVINIPLN
ncbi:MAG: hypothetical protein HYR67_07735 [Bacteroidetes bacterium]|nr:hypothetical protein [Bacteroidota bacterium]